MCTAHKASENRLTPTRNSWWSLKRLGLALEDRSAVFTGTGLGKAKWPQRTQDARGEGET